jgi:hypothetical protein
VQDVEFSPVFWDGAFLFTERISQRLQSRLGEPLIGVRVTCLQLTNRAGHHLCRVNFEVNNLKPFPHLAFPHFATPENTWS